MESFSKTHDKFWKEIEKTDPARVVENTGVSYDGKKNIFRVRVIDETYVVNLTGREISSEEPGQPVDSLRVEPAFEVKLIIVTYLTLGQGVALSGEWVSERVLPSGSFFFKGLHSLPGQKIIDAYDDNIQELKNRCIQLGGKEIESSGDFGVEFFLLPKFPARIIYRKKDEEFPAKVSFLLDRNADRFLYLDGILGLIKLLVKKIVL
jgi:hypothetical protein